MAAGLGRLIPGVESTAASSRTLRTSFGSSSGLEGETSTPATLQSRSRAAMKSVAPVQARPSDVAVLTDRDNPGTVWRVRGTESAPSLLDESRLAVVAFRSSLLQPSCLGAGDGTGDRNAALSGLGIHLGRYPGLRFA